MLHGGNREEYKKKTKHQEIYDFSANINPLGFPKWLRPFLLSKTGELLHYPDASYTAPRKAIADYYKINSNNILLCNGIAEVLMALPLALKARKVGFFSPGFFQYERAFNYHNAEIYKIPFNNGVQLLDEKLIILLESGLDVLIINNPHNPTGKIFSKIEVQNLIEKYSGTIFVIDEAFIDFSDCESFLGDKFFNLIILRSLTKIIGVPGLRIGFVVAPEDIIHKIEAALPRWNVNSLAASLVEEFYLSEPDDFFKETKENVNSLKKHFKGKILDYPIKYHDSHCNFILLECLNKNALNLARYLLEEFGVAVRTTESFDLLDEKSFFRIAVRPLEEQEIFFKGLAGFYQREYKSSKRIPAVMIQGTTSNAGKSILCTALCRIFYQDGLKVNPFKSQNMALNSYVTEGGGEIGRAQAVQAMAAKVSPSVLMNPILLKPNNETGSQVILLGKPVAHMDFKEYFDVKLKYFEEVKKAYDEISSLSDVMVIEGAGSPAEVNLKKNDIINMTVARHAKANVYLAADIDRGGMFASFMGTVNTFEEWERKLVKGFIINRFRGEQSLLNSGIDYLQKYLDIPTIGCVPFIQNHRIPEEDCIEFKSGALDDNTELNDRIDIAVIDTPRISNFTDIDAFKGEPDVRLRIVRNASELGEPHLILLCGSKSVMSDLDSLKTSGLFEKILNLHLKNKIPVVGICGGYQFLGKRILDPEQLESPIREMSGFGLLDVETVLEKEKCLGLTEGLFIPWDLSLKGYEIHHGQTRALSTQVKIVMTSKDKKAIGHSNSEGSVWGCYLHGVFDDDKFRRRFINHILKHFGKQEQNKILFRYDVDESINLLAKVVRESIDMNQVYKNLGL